MRKHIEESNQYHLMIMVKTLSELRTKYKIFAGIICSIIRTMVTFTWNFCDLLIIMVSIGLAERYKQLNEIVSYKISCNSTERINWRKIKEKYAIMNELVKEAE
ncbi:hypothetical protein HCN44_010234 [Aphidius gifuensis]|uniref:Gustatory receptor n=1 Tax=Aphidius gifuensis TaxID=684658 RepID=A0A834XYS0_APHGI|nr:hypothetical protein HCN44_010234 [Aphidius gifuensis]